MTERWQRRPDVLWRHSGQLVVLKHVEQDDFVTLASSGLALWLALETPGTLPEVASRIAEVFDVEPAGVEADITPVLADLERRHFVERTAA